MNALVRIGLGAVLLTVPLLLAGCPLDSAGSLEGLAGTYWVEHRAGELAAYALPATRGESGHWLTLETEVPAWYTGPALYEVADDGTWKRLTDDTALTLDDVLQTYDPRPSVPVTE